ncbi:hypothetical protein IKG13_02475 [Candidatus Saccharibacteria bacterium]|nr:hypothetical protein [Candidatus Saccharibacteria bacterium]
MRSSAIFANRVLSVVSVSKMPAGLWSKLCSEVIEPILGDLSKGSRTIVIDGERCDAYLDHMPLGESEDDFAKKVSAEAALELYLSQREYNRAADSYERVLADPPVEMPEEIAKRLVNGVSQVEELNRFLVIADAFVEIAEEFYHEDVDPLYINRLLGVAMDVYAHYMLLGPLDIDSSISMCGGMLEHCSNQRKKIQAILEGGDSSNESSEDDEIVWSTGEPSGEPAEDSPEDAEEPQEAEDESSTFEEPEEAELDEAEEATDDGDVEDEAAEGESVKEAPTEDEPAEEEAAEEAVTGPQDAANWAEEIEEPKTNYDNEFDFVNAPKEETTNDN